MKKKLLIQIPCYNEENTLPITISSIPKKIKGIDNYDIVVIDDGSNDKTIEIAEKKGVKYIISNSRNRGLAKTFLNGVNFFKKTNYDYLVNLDADNQYNANDIEKLVEPLLNDEFDCVIGQRKISSFKIFSYFKSLLQIIGSFVLSLIIGTKIKDVTTGFRAYNKRALEKINIYNNFSYTLESLLFFASKKIRLFCIDIETNKEVLRESRLFNGNLEYISKQIPIIVSSFAMYFPLKFFSSISIIFFTPGLILIFRFLLKYFATPDQAGNIQSLILSSIFIVVSFIFLMLGVISDLISKNRKILETMRNNSSENKINYKIIKQ